MKRAVLYLAPFPPVVNGQSIASQELANLLQAEGIELRRIDLNIKRSGALGMFGRLRRLVRAAISIISSKSAPIVYLSLNANLGMVFTLLYVVVARIKRGRVIIHHHTRRHLVNWNFLFFLISKLSGNNTFHIVICEVMASQLRSKYSCQRRVYSLSNVYYMKPVSFIKKGSIGETSGVVLGMLGNLSYQKGLGVALRSFQRAKKLGLAKKLILAGPADSYEVVRQIEAYRSMGVEWLGGVYSQKKKEEFFGSIDVFLFPSHYINETQGIVNLEALSSGTPVIATKICCIESDLDCACCCLVQEDGEFSFELVAYLRRLSSYGLRRASIDALDRYRVLYNRSTKEYSQVAKLFASDN